jgi:hypothetical protein
MNSSASFWGHNKNPDVHYSIRFFYFRTNVYLLHKPISKNLIISDCDEA